MARSRARASLSSERGLTPAAAAARGLGVSTTAPATGPRSVPPASGTSTTVGGWSGPARASIALLKRSSSAGAPAADRASGPLPPRYRAARAGVTHAAACAARSAGGHARVPPRPERQNRQKMKAAFTTLG